MRPAQSVLIASALLACSAAFAQVPGLEARLSAADFRAAGLHKLSESELARLDALLAGDAANASVIAPAAAAGANADVDARIAQAREEGRRAALEAGDDRRAEQSREPVSSTIPGPFNGFARGREYTLANGQVWKQIDGTTIAGARGQDIGVRVRPGFMSAWWLQVDGYNAQAKVERVR